MTRAAMFLAVLLWTTRAHAGPCESPLAAFPGPVELGLRADGLGVPRSPCAESTLWVAATGTAAIDVPSFYGLLAARPGFGGRVRLAGLELSFDGPAVGARFAQNASLKATETTLAPLTVGALWPFALRVADRPVALAASLRAGGSPDGGGGELSLHAGLRPRRWLALDAHLAFTGHFIAAADGTLTMIPQATLAAGAGWAARDWFAVLAGGEVALGWYGWDGLDHLLWRGGVRFTSRRAGRFEVAALAPLAGAERTDLAVQLRWSHDL